MFAPKSMREFLINHGEAYNDDDDDDKKPADTGKTGDANKVE